MASTTLKLPPGLKSRVAALAKKSGRSAHSLMLEAIERHVAREERTREFVKEALAADRAIDLGGEVYSADDVHAWLERLAKGKKPARSAKRTTYERVMRVVGRFHGRIARRQPRQQERKWR